MAAPRRPIMVRPGGARARSESGSCRHPGERVETTVTEIRDGDVVVQLAGSDRGLIDGSEFPGSERPAVGSRLDATFLQRDERQKADILTVRQPLKRVPWDSVKIGDLVEGTVTEVNVGGLVVNVGGSRGFMPVSQVGRRLRKNLGSLLRRPIAGEVTRIDAKKREVVLGLRRVLERWQQKGKARELARFQTGQVLEGTVVRRNEHGAFVDLGGVDGLLHESKIKRRNEESETEVSLDPGTQVRVEILYVDKERGRIGLGFERQRRTESRERPSLTSYGDFEVGEQVTGMVRRVEPNGVSVMLGERVEGWLPASHLPDPNNLPRKGALVKAVVTHISPRGQLELKPADDWTGQSTWNPFHDVK